MMTCCSSRDRRLIVLLAMVIGTSLAFSANVSAAMVISEFMAANASTLADEDGDFPDWIELHNTGGGAVDLNGWFLTDAAGQPGRWMFPATNLVAGGRLVVFASGKNRRVPGARLHTNFKLSVDGEYLALVDPDGTVVHAIAGWPKQKPDVSYGLVGSSGTNGFLATATPGAANAASTIDFVADTVFSHDRGFYETNFDLVISCATPGATIYYTTNGSPPASSNASAFVYSSPIVMNGTAIIRARAEMAGARPSDIDTQTYIFLRDVVRQSANGVAPAGWPGDQVNGQVFDYGLDPEIVSQPPGSATISNDLRSIPTISLVMNLPDLVDPATGVYVNAYENGRDWERSVSVELLRPTDAEDGFQLDAGIRIRGNFSRTSGNPKHSFHIVCRDDYGAARLRYPLFGDAGAQAFERFDLRTAQDDSYAISGSRSATYLADPFSRDTQLALGQPGERGDWYHLYINGQYWGLYNSCERPDASFAASYFGGTEEDYDVLRGVPASPHGAMEVVDGDDAAWVRLWRAAKAGFASNTAYYKVQGRDADGTLNPALENLLDVTNLVDYLLTIIYTGNIDGPIYLDLNTGTVNNYFAFRPRDNSGGFRFLSHDAELSLLDVNEDRAGTSSLGGAGPEVLNPHYLVSRLRANAEFKILFADRVRKHFFNGGALTPASAIARYSARTNELHAAITGESARWGDFFPSRVNAPITRSNWLNAVRNMIANYFPQRSDVVLGQLRREGLFPSVAAPEFSLPAGEVSIAASLTISNANGGGVIYYTLDGSDPRAVGGAVQATATSYSTPVVLTRSRVVKARVKSGTTWSPLTEASYRLAQDFSGLRITEIMYHPSADGAVSGDEFEFVELKNTGESLLDLGGLNCSGIAFTFTNGTRLGPGEFFVLGRNPVALAERYPGLIVHGQYSGKLANSGERLALLAPSGAAVLSVDYRDEPPWPAAADGHGFSLVPSETGADLDTDNGRAWRASSNAGGSPGADDAAPGIPAVVINEVLAHTDLPQLDAIELFNPTGADVDLGGWHLTNDRAVPLKFRIPDGTILGAGGFVVFDEDDFASGTNGFRIDSTGDAIHLFSGAAGDTNLTGYTHALEFGASANGVSFGRLINSAGDEQVAALSAVTPGTDNAPPLVGPAVINEVHYHPADGDEVFVEVLNISGGPLDLFDAASPTNLWRLSGAGFVFPAGTTLPADGLVLVVGGDPAAFRAKHSVPLAVAIFGPLGGALQNNGERLELQRPDAPNTNGVPYITVDAVRYDDRAPWPNAADGAGSSLQRRFATAYGNDPTNWFASGLTPGLTNRATLGPSISGQPLSQTVIPGTDVEFTVAALGGSLNYVWQFDGAVIPGVTGATLLLSNVTPASAGEYRAVVSDGNGSSTSLVATLTVTCAFALAGESATVGAAGGVVDVALIAPAGCGWTLAGMPSWIAGASGTNGVGGGSVGLVVAANSGSAVREAAVSIAGLPFVVRQSPPDSQRPTVTISAPVSGARVTNESARVTGTAGDNVEVARVEVAVGTDAFSAAAGTASWSATVPLAPGTNLVRVRSVDLNGNLSVTNTRTLFRVVTAPLTLATNGNGGISGATNGQRLEIGRAYTFTAMPAAGSVFSNWTGSASSSLAKLSFFMRSNASLTAGFVPNPFPAVAGSYHGLLFDTNLVLHASSGGFVLKVTDRGAYSASLRVDGLKLSATGQFDPGGRAMNVIQRRGTNAIRVDWALALDGSDSVSGSVSNVAWLAELAGDRAVFSKTSPCPFAGRYTMAWPGLAGDEFVPGGASYGAISISSNGVISLKGHLADQTSFSHQGQVSRGGCWPLYLPVYSGKGSLLSWLAFTNRTADDFHGLLNWSKPVLATARYYRVGFATNQVEAVGARYSPPAGTNTILGLNEGLLMLLGGNLGEDLTNTFRLGAPARFTNAGPHRLTLGFTTSSGLFKGTLVPTNAAAKSISIAGAILQKSTNAMGYFLGTNQSGAVRLESTGAP